MLSFLLEGDVFTAVGGVIACERIQFRAKRSGLQVIKNWQESLLVLTRQDQVIAFFKQGDEIKIMLVRGGLQAERDIGLACCDQRCSLTVRFHRLVIAIDGSGWDLKPA